MTQAQLAAVMGISQSALSKIEKGTAKPRAEAFILLFRLASDMGVRHRVELFMRRGL